MHDRRVQIHQHGGRHVQARLFPRGSKAGRAKCEPKRGHREQRHQQEPHIAAQARGLDHDQRRVDSDSDRDGEIGPSRQVSRLAQNRGKARAAACRVHLLAARNRQRWRTAICSRPIDTRKNALTTPRIARSDSIAHPVSEQEQVRLHRVDDHDGLVVIEAQRQQLVMDMIFIGAERRASLADALHHHTQGVQNRQRQQQHRRGGTDVAGAALGGAQAQHADRKSQQAGCRHRP